MDMVTDIRSICAHLRAVERGDTSPVDTQPRSVAEPVVPLMNLGAGVQSVVAAHGLSAADGVSVAGRASLRSGMSIGGVSAIGPSLPIADPTQKKKPHMRGITVCGVGMGGWLALMCAQHVPGIKRVVMLCSDSDPVISPVAQRLLYSGPLPCPVLLLGGSDIVRENITALERAGYDI